MSAAVDIAPILLGMPGPTENVPERTVLGQDTSRGHLAMIPTSPIWHTRNAPGKNHESFMVLA